MMASRWENFANTLLENAAVGGPIVATDCGGTPEIVRDNETGLLVPPTDPDAMADAILRLLSERKLAAQLGLRAWEDARERFDPSRIAEQTVGFYGCVMERFRSQRGLRA
jgi:glycosyltransferase involved in cell wall biosynthesis